MKQKLRVLYIDDYPLDRELVRDALIKEHTDFELVEAENRTKFEQLLEQGGFDLVLSDFNILGFEGLQVLNAVHAKNPEMPVIIVTGTGSEEIAVEAMKRGAADYVIKKTNHIQRLPLTIQSVWDRKQSELKQRDSEQQYRLLFENSGEAILLTSPDGSMYAANPQACQIFQKSEAEIIADGRQVLVDRSDPRLAKALEVRQKTGRFSGELNLIRKDGSIFPADVTTTVFSDMQGNERTSMIIRDVSDRKQVEHKLHASEDRYRYLFENNPLPMWVYDLNTLAFLAVNDAAVDKYGYSREEFMSMTIRDIRPPEDITRLMENIAQERPVLSNSGEWRHRLKDGAIIHVEITSHTLLMDEHQSALVVSQDITARKKVEEAIRESEANLKKAQKVANVGSWLWHVQSNQLEWSDQMYTIFGIDEEMFTGDLTEVIAQLIHPDDRQTVNAANNRVVTEGRPVPLEYRIVWKDGTIRTVWAEAGELLFDSQGTPETLTGIVQDITERKKNEELLRLQSTALNSAANAIVITDKTGAIEWINQAYEKLTGYSSQEVIGQNPRVLKSGVQDSGFYENLWKTISSGNIWQNELVNKRKDGSLYTEEETITPLVDSKGRILHFIGIKQDISDRKRSEKLLHESEERLRLALDAANQGIYDLNIQTGNAIVNDNYATMLGYDPKMFIETHSQWLDRLHPKDREVAGKTFQDYIHGRISEYRLEFRQKNATGTWIWILSMGCIVEYDSMGHPLRMLGTHTDITSSKNATLEIAHLLEESQRRLDRISALRLIDMAISSNYNLNETLDIILNQVKSQLQVNAVAILLFDDNLREFRYAASLGFRSNRIENARVKLGTSLAGKAAEKGRLIQIKNVSDEIDPLFASLLEEEGFKDYFGIPLTAKSRLVGVLELFHDTLVDVEEEWQDYFETLAGQAALAIENAQLIEGLQKANEELIDAYDATIEGWSRALDLRDKETEGHTIRVTDMTITLARQIGLDEKQLIQVRRGALLHDIGKLGVPDGILLKPSPLTEDEWLIMKKHPTFAYEMLSPIQYLGAAVDIPYCHHEKWDGTGYPRGLKGEQIPLVARIFAIVDVWDALNSDRPYRKAWPVDKILHHIQSLAGTHFDPKIVEFCLKSGLFAN